MKEHHVGITSLQVVVVGEKPNKQTSQLAASCKIVILPRSWQQEAVVELSNEKNKQFDPSG